MPFLHQQQHVGNVVRVLILPLTAKIGAYGCLLFSLTPVKLSLYVHSHTPHTHVRPLRSPHSPPPCIWEKDTMSEAFEAACIAANNYMTVFATNNLHRPL